jgi:hypothetical protein
MMSRYLGVTVKLTEENNGRTLHPKSYHYFLQ